MHPESDEICSDNIVRISSRISIFRNVPKDSIISLGVTFAAGALDGNRIDEITAELFAKLAESVELSDEPVVGNAWQNHLMNVILSDDNVFTRKAELTGFEDMGDSLIKQSRSDLDSLRRLYELDFASIASDMPAVDGFSPFKRDRKDGPKHRMKTTLNENPDWSDLIAELASFYARNGAGDFGRYRAFRWIHGKDGGYLKGADSPDPIKLSDLIEYDWQREEAKKNTQKLLAGLPTNNILLYGDRGTGKSSAVKAMLNEFPDSKLRLVEILKDHLVDLPDILTILRKRPEKFVLFIDDLSFEENETQYKALKTVLEGGLEARPGNVVLYATSNRRNIIREKFSDRIAQDDDVHPGDTMQEKLALSDRFGIKLPFLAPDQDEYLRIVRSLAEKAGIEITEELRRRAISWQHARSGRSARQFVDYVIGEMGIESS